jgi:translation initiation factor IF-3
MQNYNNKKNFRRNNYYQPIEPELNIRSPEVRVFHNGNQLGILKTDEAKKIALSHELDLVCIAEKAIPPVCHIMDFKKFKFDKKLKEKELKKKQRETQEKMKELRLTPLIDTHDIETKIHQAIGFLKDGNKVQFNLKFQGKRLMAHKERGFEILNKVIEDLKDYAEVENKLKLDGNCLRCKLKPIEETK